MRFDSISVVPGDPLLAMLLSLNDPSGESPYQILEVDGVDAGELMKSYYARGQSSGKKFFNFTLPQREVTIRVGLKPRHALGETVSSLRDNVYRHISATRDGSITIEFLDGGEMVACLLGSVSGVEPSLFDKKPTVEMRVLCPDPILRAPVRLDVPVPDGPTSEVLFDDPYSTAPHGLVFLATFTEEAKDFKIYDSTNDWFFTITPRDGFDPGDVLIFNGNPNEQAIYREREDDVMPLADVIARNSVWPIVFPLANEFQFNRAVVFNPIGHYPAYWGV